MQLFQRKTVLSIIGVAVIGVATALFMVLSSAAVAKPSGTSTQANGATATATQAAGATATPVPGTHGVTPTPGKGTATPTTTPTTTATATGTSVPTAGQQIDWIDTVRAVGTNSFTVRNHTPTIIVNGQTIYSGSARSLGQMSAGMRLEVHGTVQANGQVLGTEVNTQGDN